MVEVYNLKEGERTPVFRSSINRKGNGDYHLHNKTERQNREMRRELALLKIVQKEMKTLSDSNKNETDKGVESFYYRHLKKRHMNLRRNLNYI